MPALITFEYLSFGTISFDRMGRASRQMRIAAAFAAPNGSNEILILDDEGTPFHSPRPQPTSPGLIQSGKARGIRMGVSGAVEKLESDDISGTEAD